MMKKWLLQFLSYDVIFIDTYILNTSKKISTEELVLILFLRRIVWLDELACSFGSR
jgi:hypothetical protein